MRLADPQQSEARQVLMYHSVPASDRHLFFVFSIKSPTSTGEVTVTTCRAPMGGWHRYSGVLPGAPRG